MRPSARRLGAAPLRWSATAQRRHDQATVRPTPEPYKAPPAPQKHFVDLFLRNLPWDATSDDVRNVLKSFRYPLKSVHLPIKKDVVSGTTKGGYAFVTLDRGSSTCADVVELIDGVRLKGRKLVVSESKSRTKSYYADKDASFITNNEIIKCKTVTEVLHLFKIKGPTYSAVNLATTFHRIGTLGAVEKPDKETLGALSFGQLVYAVKKSISQDPRRWEAQGLANVAWGFAKVDRTNAQTFFDLLSAKALGDFERLGLDADGARAGGMDSWDPQALGNMVWAFATAGVQAPRLFDAVAKQAAKKLLSFTNQNLANTVWAFATAGHVSPRLFDAAAVEATKRVPTFNPQELANIVWSYTTAHHRAPSLYTAVAKEAPNQLDEAGGRALANLVWSYANAGVSAPELFEAVALEAPRQMQELNVQGLANIVWSYAVAKIAAPKLFDAIAVKLLPQTGALNANSLANTVWAYASAGVPSPDLFQAISQKIPKKAPALTSQALAQTVWAFASCGVEAPHVFKAVEDVAVWKMDRFTPDSLAIIAWAYAKADIRAPVLFAVLAPEAEIHLKTLTSDSLGKLVWAYGVAKFSSPSLFYAVAQRAETRLNSFEPQALADLALGFALAGVEAPTLFEAIASETATRMDLTDHWRPMHAAYAQLAREAPRHALTVRLGIVTGVAAD